MLRGAAAEEALEGPWQQLAPLKISARARRGYGLLFGLFPFFCFVSTRQTDNYRPRTLQHEAQELLVGTFSGVGRQGAGNLRTKALLAVWRLKRYEYDCTRWL